MSSLANAIISYAATLDYKADTLRKHAYEGAQQPELDQELEYCEGLNCMADKLREIVHENV